MLIAVCPGHHDTSPGASNVKYGLNEHEEALKVCDRLVHMLRMDGHIVSLYLGTQQFKVDQVNFGYRDQPYDLALEVHFNSNFNHLEPHSFDDHQGHGCMTLHAPDSDTGRQKANIMSRATSQYMNIRSLRGKPGWHWSGHNPGTVAHHFLSRIRCLALIPVLGYIDNDEFAENYLVEDSGHMFLAEAIHAGINAIRR